MSQEPKSRSPRIEINPEVWPALQVEAVIRRVSPKDLVNMLIMGALSPKARAFMEPMESKPHDPITPRPIATEKPKEPQLAEGAAIDSIESTGPGTLPKRKRLSEDPDATNQIKTMWQAGEKSPTKISKYTGYPKTTIVDFLKKLQERGEISD